MYQEYVKPHRHSNRKGKDAIVNWKHFRATVTEVSNYKYTYKENIEKYQQK